MRQTKNLFLLGALALGMGFTACSVNDSPIDNPGEDPTPVVDPIEENPEYQTIDLNVKATINGEANWKVGDEVRISYYYKYTNYQGKFGYDENGEWNLIKTADGLRDSFVVSTKYASTTASAEIASVESDGTAIIKGTLIVPENYLTTDKYGNPYNSIVATDTTITFVAPGIACGKTGATPQYLPLQRLQDGQLDTIAKYRSVAVALPKAVVRGKTLVVDEGAVFEPKSATVKYSVKDESGADLKVESFLILDEGLKAKGDAGETAIWTDPVSGKETEGKYANLINNYGRGIQVATIIPQGGAASEFYASVLATGVTSAEFVGATGDFSYLAYADGKYYQGKGNVNLVPGAIQEVTVTLSKIESGIKANTLPVSDANSSLGCVIGLDGKIYDVVADAEDAGTKAVAAIAYVDADGHGLALALSDISANWITSFNLTRNFGAEITPAGTTWIVPTHTDWANILKAFGGKISEENANTIDLGELNTRLEGSGAAALAESSYVLNTTAANDYKAYTYFSVYNVANKTFNDNNSSTFGLKLRPVLVF